MSRSARIASRAALAVTVMFVLFGTLFPFRFVADVGAADVLTRFGESFATSPKKADVIINIVLFAPIGFFLALALPPERSSSSRAISATLLGCALSVCIESAQAMTLWRFTSGFDVIANTVGTACGAALFACLVRKSRLTRTQKASETSS
ncbi:MAG: VanZ family protein [Rhodobacteraceae bacterium]|nr:VanZ family protein [Paracoccaceae bacterium]